MGTTKQIVKQCVAKSDSRFDLWIRLTQSANVKNMAEVGVYRGDFASKILQGCDSIEKYYMIDPWRQFNPGKVLKLKATETFSLVTGLVKRTGS